MAKQSKECTKCQETERADAQKLAYLPVLTVSEDLCQYSHFPE